MEKYKTQPLECVTILLGVVFSPTPETFIEDFLLNVPSAMSFLSEQS